MEFGYSAQNRFRSYQEVAVALSCVYSTARCSTILVEKGDTEMPLTILFWVLMLFWLFFGFWSGYTVGQPYTFRSWGGNILLFVVIAILGWAVLGPPVVNNSSATPYYQHR